MSEISDMFPNMDLETGFHYGCISQNTLDPDVLNDLIMDSDDLIYEECMQEIENEAKAAIEEGTIREFLIVHDLQDDVDEDNITLEAIMDAANQSYMNDNHQYYYDDGEYKLDFSDDMNCIIICKSPYYTFCRGCSPCVPNAGDLDEPVTPEDYENDSHTSMYTMLKKAYCFPDDFFEDNKAPYKYFEIPKDLKCQSCQCYTCERPVPEDGSGMDCTGCSAELIPSCPNTDASNTFSCGRVGEGRK
jgi:hypothetical protein